MKKSFLTGLVILLPTVLTAMIVIFLFDFFTKPFVSVVRRTLEHFFAPIPEGLILILSRLLAMILLFFIILLLGFIARHLLLNNLIKLGNKILYKIPFVKTIYKLSRDIFTAIFAPDGKKAFKETVLVPFPHKPHYCMGFSSGEVPEECEQKTGQKLISVFAPTAPHPISGFLFLVPENDVVPIQMSKEDAFKYLVSCGVVHPESENPHDHA